MDELEVKELQDPETWESTENDTRAPATSGRAVVSVAFSRSDFELVSETARDAGMKTSAFIRDAAIRRASDTTPVSVVLSVSGGVRNEFSLSQPRGARLTAHYVTEPGQTFALTTT